MHLVPCIRMRWIKKDTVIKSRLGNSSSLFLPNEEVKRDEANRVVLFIFLFTSQTAYAEFDIQFAIDQAKAGDSIHIPAGRYQGISS